jgi:hypothetical protein
MSLTVSEASRTVQTPHNCHKPYFRLRILGTRTRRRDRLSTDRRQPVSWLTGWAWAKAKGPQTRMEPPTPKVRPRDPRTRMDLQNLTRTPMEPPRAAGCRTAMPESARV